MIQYVVSILELAMYIVVVVATIVTIVSEVADTIKELIGWK